MNSFKSILLIIAINFSVHSQSKILFSRSSGGLNTGGTLDLMIYDPVNKTTKLLLRGTVRGRGEYNPSTSLNNSEIIFNTYKFGGWKLGIGDFDGSMITNIKKLTKRSNYEYCPKYSSDGSKIAYQEYNWNSGEANIYIADQEGKNATHFYESKIGTQHLDWTSDDKTIVFTSYEDNNVLSIFAKSVYGKPLKRLTNNDSNCFAPSTSKTENKIAFLSDKTGKIDLYVMDLDSGTLNNLTSKLRTTDADENSIWAYKTSWSPDGKQIVFNVMFNGNLELFVVNADGTDLTQITKNSDTDITPFWTN